MAATLIAIVLAVVVMVALGVWLLRRELVCKPGDGEIAHPDHIDWQIARFTAELAGAEAQADIDNAQGRLDYWLKEKARG